MKTLKPRDVVELQNRWVDLRELVISDFVKLSKSLRENANNHAMLNQWRNRETSHIRALHLKAEDLRARNFQRYLFL